VDTAINGELTITYRIFNSRDEEIGEPLLVVHLAADATLVSATPAPDQPPVPDGTLAFVLPNIPPFGQVQANFTVSLALSGGQVVVESAPARAFGNIRTRAVKASFEALSLPQTLGVTPDLLACTIDTNTRCCEVDPEPGEPCPADKTSPVDRYVLEKIGQIGCDPVKLFEFVRDKVGFEPYRGSLRGARGTLWSMAGNALDQASLLVGMLRACGIPARYVSGTLDTAHAQDLILSMFPPITRAVGGLDPATLPPIGDVNINDLLLNTSQFLPGADQISEPDKDEELLSETREHYWVEYFDGSRFVRLDPLLAKVDPTAASPMAASTFVEVDDAIRQKVQFRLDNEFLLTGLIPGAVLRISDVLDPVLDTPTSDVRRFGSVHVFQHTVLDRTFRTVELVGEPVSVGHFVDQQVFATPFVTIGSINTYSPWMQVGDRDELIRGTDYEELYSFLGSEVLSGLFLRMRVIDAQGHGQDFERALVDRIGSALREGEGGVLEANVSRGAPALADLDISTVYVLGGLQDFAAIGSETGALNQAQAALDGQMASTPSALLGPARDVGLHLTRLVTELFAATADVNDRTLERSLLSRIYWAAPQILMSSAKASGSLGIDLDLRSDSPRVISGPQHPLVTAKVIRSTRGFLHGSLESELMRRLTNKRPHSSSEAVLSPDLQKLLLVVPWNPEFASAPISSNARAEILRATSSGRVVILPVVSGMVRAAWWEFNPNTGGVVAVAEGGGHQAAVDYVFAWVADFSIQVEVGIPTLIGFYHGLAGASYAYAAGLVEAAAGGSALSFDQIKRDAETYANEVATRIKTAVQRACLDIDVPLPSLSLDLSGLSIEVRYACVAATLPLFSIPSLEAIAAFCAAYRCGLNAALDHVPFYLSRLLDPPLTSIREDPNPGRTLGRNSGAVHLSVGPTLASPREVSGIVDADFYALHNGARAIGLGAYPNAIDGIGTSGRGWPGASNFESSLAVGPVGDATVNLDVRAGVLSVGAEDLEGSINVGFSGFAGNVTASHGVGVDAVSLDGTAERVLLLSLDSSRSSVEPTGMVTTRISVRTDREDALLLRAQAPAGWTVQMAADGATTIAPVKGLALGTYEIRFIAKSETVPDLRAEARAYITVGSPGTPAVDVRVIPDTVFSVPNHGTLTQTAYRIEIHNLSATADTFDVAVSGLSADDFTLAVPSVFVGPGDTGIVGVAVHPTGELAPPETPISFTATAAGRATGLTDTDAASFTHPQVVGVRPSIDPTAIATLPGRTVAATLSLASAANVDETFTLSAQATDVVLNGLPPSADLMPGQTLSVPLSIDVPADTPIGMSIPVTVVADLCNGLALADCTVPQPSQRFANLELLIASDGTTALFESAVAARNAGQQDLASAMEDVALALAALSEDPANPLLRSRVTSTENVLAVLLAESGRSGLAGEFADLLPEVLSGDPATVVAAVDQVNSVFEDLPGELTDEVEHAISLSFVRAAAELEPGEGVALPVRLENQGTQPTTVNLALEAQSPLPSGVTASLNINSVTLAPGEVLDETSANPVILTLEQSLTTTTVFTVRLTGAPVEATILAQTVTAYVAVRPGLADVVSLTADPTAVDPGDPVAVAARISNTANTSQSVLAHLDLLDDSGTIVSTPPEVPVELVPSTALLAVDLGDLSTAGLPIGLYSLRLRLLTPSGEAIRGRTGQTGLYVGAPVAANVQAQPALVPPGSSLVTTIIDVTNLTSLTPLATPPPTPSPTPTGPPTLVIDGPPVTVLITVPGQPKELTFDGSTGQRISLLASGGSGFAGTVTIFNPDASTLAQSESDQSPFVDTQTLAQTGTYTIVVTPGGGVTGSATLTLYDVPPDAVGSITPGGPAVTVTIPTPGQNARLTFSGSAGQRISVLASGGTFAGCCEHLRLFNPSGTQVAVIRIDASGFMDAQTLAQTGTYTIVVDPEGAITGSLTLTLDDVPPDSLHPIDPGGPPVTVTTTTPGQNAQLTFSGSAGQRISVLASGGTFTGCCENLRLFNPSGTQVAVIRIDASGFMDAQTLAQTGTYSIVVDPEGTIIGSLTLTLDDVPPDSLHPIDPGGPPVTVTTTTPGQNAQLTFSGSAGQRISMLASGGTFTGWIGVSLFGASGTNWRHWRIGASYFVEPQTLAQTGTYSVVVDPEGAITGSLTLTLYDVPPDAVGSITPGGPAVSATAVVPGHNPQLTFSGTTGQRISVLASGGTFSGCCEHLRLFNPSGTQVAVIRIGASGFMDTQTLTQTGTYSVMVDPEGTITGSLTLTLYDVPADNPQPIDPGGPPVTVSIATPGQSVQLTFSGSAGQQVNVQASGGTFTGCCTYVRLLNPDGTQVAAMRIGQNGVMGTRTLPQTGTYSIVVDPEGAITGSLTLSL